MLAEAVPRSQEPFSEIATRRVAALVYEGVQLLDLTAPLGTFEVASRLLRERFPEAPPAYEIEVLGPEPGPVATAAGPRLVASAPSDSVLQPIDTLIVPGGARLEGPSDERVLEWLREHGPAARRLAGVGSGVLLLAEAGLLEGRRATAHWSVCELLRHRHPGVKVERDLLFVADGGIYTAAGQSAGIDLALALVEEDLSRTLALAAARELVQFVKRPGGQAQISAQLSAQIRDTNGDLEELRIWILENLDRDLRVESLAERIRMSPRNLARVFVRDLGTTPARFVELARLEAARQWIEESPAPLKYIARRCGFGSLDRMRRSFWRHMKMRPSDYRRLHSNGGS